MVLLVKMVFLDRKEKGDILGLEEFLEILRKEFLAFQGQLGPLENLAGMEHQAYVASKVLKVFDNYVIYWSCVCIMLRKYVGRNGMVGDWMCKMLSKLQMLKEIK